MTPHLTLPPAPRRDLGGGVYGLPELRAYVAFSGSSDDAAHVLPWLTRILNPVPHQPRRPDYSFSDLVSLFVVRELRRKGVAPHVIRDAELWLRRKWKTDRPFVSDEIQTDGRHVFFDDELIPGQIESADQQGQQTLLEPIRDRLTRVHYSDGAAAYWTPRTHVLVDPRIQFGEPVVAGTRVPTQTVADTARHLGLDAAVSRFDIPAKAVRSAVAFERKIRASLN